MEKKTSPVDRLEHAFSKAEQHLGIERLLDPEGNYLLTYYLTVKGNFVDRFCTIIRGMPPNKYFHHKMCYHLWHPSLPNLRRLETSLNFLDTCSIVQVRKPQRVDSVDLDIAFSVGETLYHSSV